jgi:N-methylhydantoinase B
LKGGKSPPPHKLYLRKGDEVTEIDAESFYAMDKGDMYEIYESGGGGYGNPKDRSVDKVRNDVIDGLVSVDNARIDYGVVIDPKSFSIDEQETAKLRKQ